MIERIRLGIFGRRVLNNDGSEESEVYVRDFSGWNENIMGEIAFRGENGETERYLFNKPSSNLLKVAERIREEYGEEIRGNCRSYFLNGSIIHVVSFDMNGRGKMYVKGRLIYEGKRKV